MLDNVDKISPPAQTSKIVLGHLVDPGERIGVGSIDHSEALASVGRVHQGWMALCSLKQEQSMIPASSIRVMVVQFWVGSTQVKAEQAALADGPKSVAVQGGVEHLDEQR